MSKARKKGAASNKKGGEKPIKEEDEDVPSQEEPEVEQDYEDVDDAVGAVDIPVEPEAVAPEAVLEEADDVPLPTEELEEPMTGVDADATEAAIEAAVVAATANTNEMEASKDDTTAAEVAAIVQEAILAPSDRDVILGEGSAGHKTNLLLQDMIRLHRLLWTLHGKPPPTTAEEVRPMVDRIVAIIKNGKSFELAGLKDVPKPFMKSSGRFFGLDATTGGWKILEDDEVNTILIDAILEAFNLEDLGPLTDSPFSDLKEWITKNPGAATVEFLPEAKDAILLPVSHEADKMYETQQGNKTLFHLASQLVTSHTNSPDKRVEAALSIMRGLDETLESMGTAEMSKLPTTTMKARFLIRSLREDRSVAWHLMDSASAAEFTVIFVFEVFLEKEIHCTDTDKAYSSRASGSLEDGLLFDDNDAMSKPSTVPIAEPTDHDVLFGRGGMTNSHPGNRRFRDIIALHRPDYIRAVKMDKPAVARKIVRAIRQGFPQGRFLKKADDGMYYDVGDRCAAEKTSQGLRERTNAEKRQRSALREALRIRKQDMAEDEDDGAEGDAKKAKTDIDSTVPTLNYVGTDLPVPLSLNMKDISTVKTNVVRSKKPKPDKVENDELNCAGLPPNAVDEEGNILVTDHDILCGRGGLTNHHKGNKRFRDIVALHRPDYVRAPKIQKPSVARVIVRAIRNGDPPGRFLRKDEKTGRWIDIGDKKAAEKTSQALREKPNEELGNGAPPRVAATLLPNPDSYLAGTVVPAVTHNVTVATGIAASILEESKTEVAPPPIKEDANLNEESDIMTEV